MVPFNAVDSQFKAVGNFDDERVGLPGWYCDRGPAGRCAFPGCVSGDGLSANGSRLPVLTRTGHRKLTCNSRIVLQSGQTLLHYTSGIRRAQTAEGPHNAPTMLFATSASLFALNASAFFANAVGDLRPCVPRSSGSRHSSPFLYRKARYNRSSSPRCMMYAAFATDK